MLLPEEKHIQNRESKKSPNITAASPGAQFPNSPMVNDLSIRGRDLSIQGRDLYIWGQRTWIVADGFKIVLKWVSKSHLHLSFPMSLVHSRASKLAALAS